MESDRGDSLRDEATFAGKAKQRPASEASIGDERTLGDNRSGQETVIDDIEVVDLEARYRVEGTLGEGGMGAVLLATDTRLDRKVAIKRILGEAAGNPMAVQRFLTEAKAIAALNHPNIVQIHDYGRAKDGPFLIMEYVDGGSLLDRCRESALPLDEAINLACQLCDGLAKAHDLGIIHRDIKPANVLLTKDGIPKLTDFGLAKAQAGDHGQTVTGAVLGTPDFMPPEQRRDASLVDHRSDLWSLAATVYQMVTGRSPKIIRFDLLPSQWTNVLGKALEEGKDQRFQTARELRDAIGALRGARQTVFAHTAELGVGECPQCHTPNSPTRKFCAECAATLRASCLQCVQEIPIWDKVCPECGAKQQSIIDSKRQEFEAICGRVEQHLANCAFQAARQLIDAWRTTDARFGDIAPRVEQIAGQIARKEQQEVERKAALRNIAHLLRRQIDFKEQTERDERDALVAKAKLHLGEYRHAAAITTLRSIPPHVRTREVESLLAHAVREEDELAELETAIKQSIAERVYDGLVRKVSRACELTGNRSDLSSLRNQLVQREQKRSSDLAEAKKAAREAAAAGDYSGAIEVLERLGPSFATDVEADIRRLTDDKNEASRLLQTIKRKVQSKDTRGLLPLIRRCSAMLPRREDLRKLLVDVEEHERAREAKTQAVWEKAVASFEFDGDPESAGKQLDAIRADLSEGQQSYLGKVSLARAAESQLAELTRSTAVAAGQDEALLRRVGVAVAECLELNPANRRARKTRKEILQVLATRPDVTESFFRPSERLYGLFSDLDEDDSSVAEKALVSCRESLNNKRALIPLRKIALWCVVCPPLGLLLLLTRVAREAQMRHVCFNCLDLVGKLLLIAGLFPIMRFIFWMRYEEAIDFRLLAIGSYFVCCGFFTMRFHTRMTHFGDTFIDTLLKYVQQGGMTMERALHKQACESNPDVDLVLPPLTPIPGEELDNRDGKLAEARTAMSAGNACKAAKALDEVFGDALSEADIAFCMHVRRAAALETSVVDAGRKASAAKRISKSKTRDILHVCEECLRVHGNNAVALALASRCRTLLGDPSRPMHDNVEGSAATGRSQTNDRAVRIEFGIAITDRMVHVAHLPAKDWTPELSPIMLPSMPAVMAIDVDGKLHTGADGHARMLNHDASVVTGHLSLLGRKTVPLTAPACHYGDAVVQASDANEVELFVRGHRFSPDQLAATVFTHVQKQMITHTVDEHAKCVIAVPATFGTLARHALRRAAAAAGVQCVRLVTMTHVEALACRCRHVSSNGSSGGEDFKGIVIHWDDSCCEVTVFDASHDGVIQIISTRGDAALGAAHCKKLLVDHLVRADATTANEPDMTSLERRWLWSLAETIHKDLQEASETHVVLPNRGSGIGMTQARTTCVTRGEYDDMCCAVVQGIRGLVRQALQDGKLAGDDVDGRIYLTGSEARALSMQDIFSESFPGKNIRSRVWHEDVASWGAALLGSVLDGRTPELLLVTTVPWSIGIETAGGIFMKLLERNTSIPTERKAVFAPVGADVKGVAIRVFEGERPMAMDNEMTGAFRFEQTTSLDTSALLEVVMDIDADTNISVGIRNLADKTKVSHLLPYFEQLRDGLGALGYYDEEDAAESAPNVTVGNTTPEGHESA